MQRPIKDAMLRRANRPTYNEPLPLRVDGVRGKGRWILPLAAAMTMTMTMMLVLSACSGSSSSAPQTSGTLAGNWQFSMTPPDPAYPTQVQYGLQGGFLLQNINNSAVTGQAVYSVSGLTGPNGTWAICNSGTATLTGATINGHTVTLTYQAGTLSSTPNTPTGQTYVLTGTLSADGSTMSGTFTATAGAVTAADGTIATCGIATTDASGNPIPQPWTAISVPPLTGSFTGSYPSMVSGDTYTYPVTGFLNQGENIGASNATVTGTLNFKDPATGLKDDPAMPASVSVNGQISGNTAVLQLIGTNGLSPGGIGSPGFPATFDPTSKVLSTPSSTSTPGVCLALNGSTACQQPILMTPALVTFPIPQIVGNAEARTRPLPTPATQTITITNNSSVTQSGLTLGWNPSQAPNGLYDFTILGNPCGVAVGKAYTLYPAGSSSGPSSCTVTIQFAPQEDDCEVSGSERPFGTPTNSSVGYSGHIGKASPVCPPLSTTLTVNGATGSPDQATSFSVPVTGVGLSAIQASTPELDFDAWAFGETDPPSQTLTYTNYSNYPVTILSSPSICNYGTTPPDGLEVVVQGSSGVGTCDNINNSGVTATPNFVITNDSCSGQMLAAYSVTSSGAVSPSAMCNLTMTWNPQQPSNLQSRYGCNASAGTYSCYLELNTVQCTSGAGEPLSPPGCELDSGRFPVELIVNLPSPLRMSANPTSSTPTIGNGTAMLNFGTQLEGQIIGSTQTITLYNDPNDPSNSLANNPNQAPLIFPAKAAVKGGDYSEFDTCVYTLAIDSSCTMTITFTPTVPGFDPGLITIATQPANGTINYQYVYLLGTGQ